MFRLSWESIDKSSSRSLELEYKANDIAANALFLLSRNDKNFRLRVPLFARCFYRGFKILAHALPPLDAEHTLEHGPTADGTFISMSDMAMLRNLGGVLNLKEH
jgi:hypothetical protein